MKKVLYLFFMGLMLACNSESKSGQKMDEEEELPNIVFIVSDDQSWPDYSFMGHPHIETPRIDQLLAEGTTYTRGYLTAPVCSPSLASIITGLYPHQHGITGNDPKFTYSGDGPKYREDWLRERKKLNDILLENFRKNPTLPQLLAEKGYKSFQTGKWWGGSYKDGGFTEGMTTGDPEDNGRHGDIGLKIGRDGMEPIYDFIDRTVAEDDPFFVWYAPFLPHTPHTPPDSLYQKYKARTSSDFVAKYWAMVEWFDITVGQLLDRLDDQGLAENTLIVYVVDNGWIQHPERNGYQWPSKQSPYDMGMRSPISLKWPGKIPVKMDTSTFVSSTDLLPTVLEIVGLQPTNDMMGIDLLNENAVTSRSAVYSEDYNHDIEDVNEPTKSLEHRMMMQRPWKLIMPVEEGHDQEMEMGGGGNYISILDGPKLYNVVEDPYETNNVADQYPEIVAKMTAEMNQWWNPNN